MHQQEQDGGIAGCSAKVLGDRSASGDEIADLLLDQEGVYYSTTFELVFCQNFGEDDK